MRRIFLALGALLVAATTAILAPTLAAGAAEDSPSASQLIAKLKDCEQISQGKYKPDSDEPEEIPVCQTEDVVWWESDLDIDCDGKPTDKCSASTDPWFQDETAYTDDNDQPLVSDTLPYIVVPSTSDIWKFTDSKIDGGTLAAVIYNDKVQYAVVGDTGPEDIIGEASYAVADALGINPDPKNGGTDGPVHFLLFTGSKASSWDKTKIVDEARGLAEEFAGGSTTTSTVKPTSSTNPPVTRRTSTDPSVPASSSPEATTTVTVTVTATLIPPTVTVTETPPGPTGSLRLREGATPPSEPQRD